MRRSGTSLSGCSLLSVASIDINICEGRRANVDQGQPRSSGGLRDSKSRLRQKNLGIWAFCPKIVCVLSHVRYALLWKPTSVRYYSTYLNKLEALGVLMKYAPFAMGVELSL